MASICVWMKSIYYKIKLKLLFKKLGLKDEWNKIKKSCVKYSLYSKDNIIYSLNVKYMNFSNSYLKILILKQYLNDDVISAIFSYF